MQETEEADQISIIHLGELVVNGTPAELRKAYSSSTLAITTHDRQGLHSACARAGLAVTFGAGSARIAVEDSAEALRFIKDNEQLVDDFELRHGTMDDVFLSLTANRGAK